MRNGRERRPPGPARAAPPPQLATERGGDVSCVPSVGFRGMWGTWPAPRLRTAWSFPIEGEGSSAGLRVRAGTRIDRGARGHLGSPGNTNTPPPHAAGGSHWREAAGKKRGKRRQANPGGVRGAGFHFGFGWRAGPPSPAVPAAWHGQAAPAASAAPPSAGCDRGFAEQRLHAGGGQGRPGSRAVAEPRRGRLAGPGVRGRAPGGGGKRPLPPGPPRSAGCEGNRIPLPCAAREPVPGSRRLPGASKEEDTS